VAEATIQTKTIFHKTKHPPESRQPLEASQALTIIYKLAQDVGREALEVPTAGMAK
jgi:hypothetical protein